jgi:hypothetical protein
MIKIILITGFSLVSFMIVMLVIVAVDQQKQIKRGKPVRNIRIIK